MPLRDVRMFRRVPGRDIARAEDPFFHTRTFQTRPILPRHPWTRYRTHPGPYDDVYTQVNTTYTLYTNQRIHTSQYNVYTIYKPTYTHMVIQRIQSILNNVHT